MNNSPANRIREWSSFFAELTSYFVTLTFNWKGSYCDRSCANSLKSLSRALDEKRLGGRFYEHTFPDRTLFFFIPEKLDSYAHYHGLVREPDNRSARNVTLSFTDLLADCWREVSPAGNIDVQPLRDEGALFYASKETSLDSDQAIFSFDYWSPSSRT